MKYSSVRVHQVLVLIASGFLSGCAEFAGSELDPAPAGTKMQTCRPRLFIRDVEWPGGLSVAQLRQRATTQPFADKVRLLRSTRANLAMKWLMTGDEDAAKEALAALKSFNAKLDTSEEGTQLVDVALAYDWLYKWPGFTADDKRAVEDRMIALAREMARSLYNQESHIFHTRMYSWTAGLGLAGLALHDVRPEAAGFFDLARQFYEQRLLPARKLQGGVMHNGLSYGPNYMMFPLLQFLEAAKSGADIDYFHAADPTASQWLREMSQFLIYTVQPDMNHVLYGDVSTTDPAKHYRFMLDIFAAEFRDVHAAELARQISERFKGSGYHAEWIYMFFAFHDPRVAPRPIDDMPAFRVFSPNGVGHAFWRSDWTADATLLHFRCGDYFEDHGHFDQGSFTIFRRGPLALQSGGYWGFNTPHRHHYFKQAISTNTVIFSDPAGPQDEGQQRNMHYQNASTFEEYVAHKRPGASPCVETGNIIAIDDPTWAVYQPGDPAPSRTGNDDPWALTNGLSRPRDSGFHCVVADVTPAWDPAKVKRYIRRIAIVNNEHVVVVDEIELAKPTIRARWLLHTQAEPKKSVTTQPESAGVVPTWVASIQGSQLTVQSLLPGGVKATMIGGEGRECEVNGVNYPYTSTEKYLQYHKNEKEHRPSPKSGLWRMELEDPAAGRDRLFVTVLTAASPGAAAPAASSKRAGQSLTVELDGGSVVFFGVK